jgi:uncharacterized membrane protein YphA (DoxX/SURF4 family)
MGVGGFIKIVIPWPEVLAPMVASLEITCGTLLLLGLLTRLAAIPLIMIMCVAIATTKLPIAHEARADFSMLLGSLFLLIVGADPISIDGRIGARQGSPA